MMHTKYECKATYLCMLRLPVPNPLPKVKLKDVTSRCFTNVKQTTTNIRHINIEYQWDFVMGKCFGLL